MAKPEKKAGQKGQRQRDVRENLRRYARKARPGSSGLDPNDRRHDHAQMRGLRRVAPEALDRLIHGEEDPSDSAAPSDAPAPGAPRPPSPPGTGPAGSAGGGTLSRP